MGSFRERFDAADPDTQREVARWTARRACAKARLTQLGQVVAAQTALDRCETLPPPFDGDCSLRTRIALLTDPAVPRTQVTTVGGRSNFSQQSLAFAALCAAGKADSLAAVTDALRQAANAFGMERYGVLFDDVPQAFPRPFVPPGQR